MRIGHALAAQSRLKEPITPLSRAVCTDEEFSVGSRVTLKGWSNCSLDEDIVADSVEPDISDWRTYDGHPTLVGWPSLGISSGQHHEG